MPTTGSLKERFRRNVAAIKTVQTIELEGRERATPEEQETISQFTGWGQFPGLFGWTPDWAKERDEFKELVSEEEHAEAQSAIKNSHFTAPEVLHAHWQIARKLGFKGGRFLETSAGSGHYIGTMPADIAGKTHVTAVEKEPLTAKMCKYLYPAAHVENVPFEHHAAPDNFYDLVASNVPFGDFKVHDPRYNKHRAPIHDYFFLKSADLARPGGLVMHVTSTGTLDKPDKKGIREHLAKSCDFVGAIRFPQNIHKGSANTDVVTDLVILRKRRPGEEPASLDQTPPEAQAKPGFTGVTTDSLGRVYHWRDGKRVPGDEWLKTEMVPDPDGGAPIEVNSYFARHPEQMLGRLDRTGSRLGEDTKNVSRTDDFDERLAAAIDRLPAGIYQPDATPKERFAPSALPAPGDVKPGSYAIVDGQLYQRHGGALEPIEVSDDVKARIEGQIAIRDAMRATLNAQVAGDTEGAEQGRKQLNAAYDAYVAKFGALNQKKNLAAYQDDPDSRPVRALEEWDAKAKKAAKAAIFSRDVAGAVMSAAKADSIGEAVGISLHETAGIDLERIAALTGKSADEIGDELLDERLAFPDPSRGWVPAAEYLSGNVKRKLVEAKSAAANDPRYKVNVEALEKVQPEDIDYSDIDVKLSTPWIPPSDIEAFARYLTGYHADAFSVTHNSVDGSWEVKLSGYAGKHLKKSNTLNVSWGTPDYRFDELLEAALNNKSLVVKTPPDKDGKTSVDIAATEAAKNKLGEIREAFKGWVWEDDERRDRLAKFYNANFNNLVKTPYDGSHLRFPGMTPTFEMRDIQKNFVWQVLTTGRGLCAHEVGLGKTASMVAAGIELRRLGLARKPAIVCLKSNVEQITREAQELYPAARIISTAGQYDEKARNEAFSRIATGDYDLVVMTHDHLNKLPMSPEVQAGFIREELKEIEAAIEATFEADRDKGNRMRKPLEKAKANMEAALKKALEKSSDKSVTFEQSGIDVIMVDEAHKFKSLPVYTRQELKGVPTGKSQRATNLLMKTQWLQERNGGRGVVFATGTPIANTMAEIYNMQRFLQPGVLKDTQLSHFDAWMGMFGEPEERAEFTVAGQYKPVRRLAKFGNVAELQQMAFQFLDVQRADSVKTPDGKPVILRPERRDHVVVTPKNERMESFMREIELRAKSIGRNRGKGADNMLVICTDGRKAAVDMRLFDHEAEDHPESKVNKCVDKLMELYHGRPGTTQLVFSDVGVHPPKPKKKKATDALTDADTYIEAPEVGEDEDDDERNDGTVRPDLQQGSGYTGHSVYQDMIDKLVARGVPREEIADFGTLEGKAREEAQAGMRAGTVRIGFGSTARLGTGTNVQKRITAMHHLDVPWTPADLEQREGRGYRHGNMNAAPDAQFPGIDIYKYVAEGSLDQAFWQIVARKAGFIHQFQNAKQGSIRQMRDEDTESLTPEQLMAVASGDIRVFDKINLEDEIKRLESQRASHASNQSRLAKAVTDTEKTLADMETEHAAVARDASHVTGHVADRPDFRLTVHHDKHKATEHDERKPAEQALLARIGVADEEIGDIPSWRWDDDDAHHVGTYRDMPILRLPGKRLRLVGPSGQQYPVGESLQSIDYVARNLGTKADKLRASIEETRADRERVKAQIGAAWPKEELLKAKKAELAALDAELKKRDEPAASGAASASEAPARSPRESGQRVATPALTRPTPNEISALPPHLPKSDMQALAGHLPYSPDSTAAVTESRQRVERAAEQIRAFVQEVADKSDGDAELERDMELPKFRRWLNVIDGVLAHHAAHPEDAIQRSAEAAKQPAPDTAAETPAQTMARVEAANVARKTRINNHFAGLPDGFTIRAGGKDWKKKQLHGFPFFESAGKGLMGHEFFAQHPTEAKQYLPESAWKWSLDNASEPTADKTTDDGPSNDELQAQYREIAQQAREARLTPIPFEEWRDRELSLRARRDVKSKLTSASMAGHPINGPSEIGGLNTVQYAREPYADEFRLTNPPAKPKPASFENSGAGKQGKLFSGLNALSGQRDLFDDLDKPAEKKPARELFSAGGWKRYFRSSCCRPEEYDAHSWDESKHPRGHGGQFSAAHHERKEIADHFASAKHARDFGEAKTIRQAAMRRLDEWARKYPDAFHAERAKLEREHAAQPESARYGRAQQYAKFEESDHPRDEKGQFSPKEVGRRHGKESDFIGKKERQRLLHSHGHQVTSDTVNEFMAGFNEATRPRREAAQEREKQRLAPYLDQARDLLDEDADSGMVEELASQLADAAEEEQERERAGEEAKNRSSVRWSVSGQAIDAVSERFSAWAAQQGCRIKKTHTARSGKSEYYDILLPDGENSLSVRISDHYAPAGAGWNEQTQSRHSEPDINLVVDLDKSQELTQLLSSIDDTSDWYEISRGDKSRAIARKIADSVDFFEARQVLDDAKKEAAE